MKYTPFILLILFTGFPAGAQSTFAPAGSEWYHSHTYGVFHCYYAGDTVVVGQPCRIIMRKALTADPYYSMGLHVYDQPPLFVYNTADTVFVYNTFFHRFTPLYVFNINDGDTIKIPIIPLSNCCEIMHANTDSTFSVRVDSVRMKLYDTTMLKTVYIHQLGNTDSNYVYNYGLFDSEGVYVEKIGGLITGFIPAGWPAACTLDDACQGQGAIRCYSDPSLSIKLVTGICGIPPTQVLTINNSKSLSLYPNPAHDELIVTAAVPVTDIKISNLLGQAVYNGVHNAQQVRIDISALPGGVYFVQVNGLEVRKFVKK